jgi:hypothetical protein
MASLSELTLLDALTSSTAGYYETGNWTKMSWCTSPLQPSASGAAFVSFSATTGSYWNAASFGSGSAVTVKYQSGSQANERYFALWVDIAPASHNGYRLKVVNTTENTEHKWKAILYKVTAGTETELGASTEQTEELTGQELALWNNAGTLEAWRKPVSGEWASFLSHADSTYNTGNVGMDGSGSNPHFQSLHAGTLFSGKMLAMIL